MKAHIDDGYRLLAAGYYRKQAKQLADQLDGVRTADDIESIHRARVASRRLRAAIGLLGEWVSTKQSKRWQKEIRRITAGLGDARDKDVQIDFLCRALSNVEDPACCPGIAHLVMHLEYQREMVQPTVVAAVERLASSGVLEEIEHEADQVTAELGKPKDMLPTPFAKEHCDRQIRKRLKKFLALQDCLENPDDDARHHKMRIAAKRLRYTLEICKPLYPTSVEEILAAVKNAQTLLGEIHDCDVWVSHLDDFLEEEQRRMAACFGGPRPFARVRIGLAYLQANRRQARGAVFEELIDYWQALRSQGIWAKLAAMVGEEVAPAPQQTEATPASNGTRAAENGNGHHHIEASHTQAELPPDAEAETPPRTIGHVAGGS